MDNTAPSYDIINNAYAYVHPDCVIELSDKSEANNNDKKNCKILKFNSSLTFQDVLVEISKLNPKEYPILFIFIIDNDNFEFFEVNSKNHSNKLEILENCIEKFYKNRPLVLQLKSINENILKCFYKLEDATKIEEIDIYSHDKNFNNFPSFFSAFINNAFEIEEFDNILDDKYRNIDHSTLITRFYTIFHHQEEALKHLVFNCGSSGSKSDLLALLNAHFDSPNKINHEYFLYSIYEKEEDAKKENFKISLLYSAVTFLNSEVVNFLIENHSNLIQNLPFDYQVAISTVALETEQFSVVRDLIQNADFPFPKNFNPNKKSNKMLKKITNLRNEFHDAIYDENLTEISRFIEKNKNITIGYSFENESALHYAWDNDLFKSFFHLKSLGYRAVEFEYYTDRIKSKKKSVVETAAKNQTTKNVEMSTPNAEKTVMILTGKSTIYKRNFREQSESEYRCKIKSWLSDVYKINLCSKMMDFIAKNENFEIIFDFECEIVDYIDLNGIKSLEKSHTIYIAGKLSRHQNNHTIKGIIAREICCYVLRVFYENKGWPFYLNDVDRLQEFDEIFKEHKRANLLENSQVNEIYGNNVKNNYKRQNSAKKYNQLIARAFQYLPQNTDENGTDFYQFENFEEIYKFIEVYVLPDLNNVNLKHRENVRKLNKICGVLPKIQELKYQFSKIKDLTEVIRNCPAIVTTNASSLLLLNVLNYIQKIDGNLSNSKNIFIMLETLKNSEIVKKFMKLAKEDSGLRIFVDCSKDPSNLFANMPMFKQKEINIINTLIFIVSSRELSQELNDFLNQDQVNMSITQTTINYDWNDLTTESQRLLLQTKIKFQNETKYSIYELIFDQDDSKKLNNSSLSDVLDDQLFKNLVEKVEISVNTELENDINFEHFAELYKDRSFVKKIILNLNANQKEDQKISTKLSECELLKATKDYNLILISDVAGSGTSWTLKKLTESLRRIYPKKWVSFVDLKHFIENFKLYNAKLDSLKDEFSPNNLFDSTNVQQSISSNSLIQNFEVFMHENILKTKSSFESKIFSKLYKNGKICILFDGFHEIVPNYSNLVINLFKSFKYNGDNQLWIACRDYYEIELINNLKVDALYKLEGLGDENGIDLIETNWMLEKKQNLDGVIDDTDPQVLLDNFDKELQKSSNFENFKESANNLVKKVNTTGTPQFYKMIANSFKNNKNLQNYSKYKIFSELAKAQYEIWAYYKGELAKTTNSDCVEKTLKYSELHQFFALLCLFPSEESFCNLEFEDSGWSHEEVFSCGLLTMKNGIFVFIVEGFRDFYVADFILKGLLNLEFNDAEEFYEIFINVLKNEKSEKICEIIDEELEVYMVNKRNIKNFDKNLKLFQNELNDFSASHQHLSNINNLFSKIVEKNH